MCMCIHLSGSNCRQQSSSSFGNALSSVMESEEGRHTQERFMAVDFAGDPLAELTHYQQLGVDGVFVDCPSTAKEWLLATGQLSAGPSSWAGTIVSGPGEHSLLVALSCLTACMAWSASTIQCYQGMRGQAHPTGIWPLCKVCGVWPLGKIANSAPQTVHLRLDSHIWCTAETLRQSFRLFCLALSSISR